MIYSINIKRSAQKSLAGIVQPHRSKIIEQIQHLADNPRLRIGAYRAIYEINDNQLVVLVVNIAHRSKVYK